MEESLGEIILRTTNPETVQQASEQLQQLLRNPDVIPVLFRLFSGSDNVIVKKASLTYLHQIIRDNWRSIPIQAQNEVKQFLLSLFQQAVSEEFVTMICDIIGVIYKEDAGEWTELISGIFTSWNQQPFTISQVLISIIDLFQWDAYEDAIPQFIEMITSFILSSNLSVQIAGLKIFSSIYGSISDYENTPNFLATANQVANNSINYQPNDFTSIWNSMNAIISTGINLENPDEQSLELFRQTAFQLLSNRNIESTLRILPLTAIINGISYFSNFIEPVLDFCIDVIAQTIEESNVLPFDLLDLIDTVLKSQQRAPIYNAISIKLFNVLQSGSVTHMAAALLTLRVLLVDAPDCAHRDIQKIVQLLQTAISSANPLLIQAAASVVESFEDSFSSINVFGVDLLKGILQFTVNPIAEVRHHCLKASLIICDNLDTEIPNFFRTVWNLYNKSSPDDITLFFTLIAYSIKLTTDFSDENTEVVFKLLQTVVNNKDLNAIASSMTIIHALISFDSELGEQLIPMIMPSIEPCLSFENNEVVSMTINFLRECITFFHEAAVQMILPFINRIVSFITDQFTDTIKAAALLACSRLVKYHEDQNIRNSLLPTLFTAINKYMDSESIELQIAAAESIRALVRVMADEQKFEFFKKLVEQVENHIEISVIECSLRSIARIVKVSQHPQMIEMSMNLLSNIISGNVSFLHGLPLIQIDTAVLLFSNICRVITSLIAVQCPVTNQICEFLLQWLKRDSELDKSTAIGALSDAVMYDAVSPEICQNIVSAVAETIPNATDPAMQENIIYLFNICVIKQSGLIPSIMGVLNVFLQWWQTAVSNESGFSEVIDNLSSLFLGLAITVKEFPDDVLFHVFDKFPRADNMNNSNMCRNILSFINERQNNISQELQHKIAISLVKLFMFDKYRLDEMQIDNELLQQMQTVLLTILRNMPPVLQEIKQMCRKSKAKARRLSAIVSSLNI